MSDYIIVDKAHPSPFDEFYFEATKQRELGHGVTWRFYKHWGQCSRAGEGIAQWYTDRSGCIHEMGGLPWTNAPTVVQAREYRSGKGAISAVLSYPHGIGFFPDVAGKQQYFWEIYQTEGEGKNFDIERFGTEEEMEARVLELLRMDDEVPQ